MGEMKDTYTVLVERNVEKKECVKCIGHTEFNEK
jgi:Zn ribbon nucleic-acid-binding protein